MRFRSADYPPNPEPGSRGVWPIKGGKWNPVTGVCMHTDDVRCSNCQTPFEAQLEDFKPNAMLRAIGRVMQDGPCEVPGCFICEGKP